MKDNNKGFSEIVLILVIVALLGVVGFFVYQNYQPKENDTSIKNPTENTQESIDKLDGSEIAEISGTCDPNEESGVYENIFFCIPDNWLTTEVWPGKAYSVINFEPKDYTGYGDVEPVFKVSNTLFLTFDSGAFCFNEETIDNNLLEGSSYVEKIRTIGVNKNFSHTGNPDYYCDDPIAQTVEVRINNETYYFEIGLQDVEGKEQQDRVNSFHKAINSIQ